MQRVSEQSSTVFFIGQDFLLSFSRLSFVISLKFSILGLNFARTELDIAISLEIWEIKRISRAQGVTRLVNVEPSLFGQ